MEWQMGGEVHWRIEWKPEDLWIGVYWERKPETAWGKRYDGEWLATTLHVWVCILPMLPIHLKWPKQFAHLSDLEKQKEYDRALQIDIAESEVRGPKEAREDQRRHLRPLAGRDRRP
jgi:hypothetical protein